MWGESNVVGFGHIGDPSRLRDTAGVRDIWLDNIDASGFKVGPHVLSSEKSFAELVREGKVSYDISKDRLRTHGNGNVRLSVELLHFWDLTREERLFNKQRLVRFQGRCQLLCQRLVHSTVKVETDVNTNRLDVLEALNSSLQRMGRVKPAKLEQCLVSSLTHSNWKNYDSQIPRRSS